MGAAGLTGVASQNLEALPSLGTAYRRDRGDGLWDLLHQFGQGIFRLGDLCLKKVPLLEQAVRLDAHSIDRQALRQRTGLPRRWGWRLTDVDVLYTPL